MQCAGFNHLLSEGKVCGIYKITSSLFNTYVGQSVDIGRRFREHKAGRSSNKLLSDSVTQHGHQAHMFEILEVCEPAELNEKEKHYVRLYQSHNTIHGFNSTKGGSSWPALSEETKRKIGEKSKGRKLSEKQIQSIKKANTGRIRSDELKERISESLKGRVFSDEHKRKIGVKSKGRPLTEEAKKKLSKSRTGYKLPDEKRAEWSKNRTGKSNNFFGKKHSEEAKQKMREARALRKPKNIDNHG